MEHASNWIVVASADHAARGQAEGFMQACHGKAAPLRRMRPGDIVACYAPREVFGTDTPCRAFVAIGQVLPREPWQHEMAPGFIPWRRAVSWLPAQRAPAAPLQPRLACAAQGWGWKLRSGFFPISADDMALIARAMGLARLLPTS